MIFLPVAGLDTKEAVRRSGPGSPAVILPKKFSSSAVASPVCESVLIWPQRTVTAGAMSFIVNTVPTITAALATVLLCERFTLLGLDWHRDQLRGDRAHGIRPAWRAFVRHGREAYARRSRMPSGILHPAAA